LFKFYKKVELSKRIKKLYIYGTVKEVEFLNGVWSIKFLDLVELLKVAPEHMYQQRVNNTKGNAKVSFVLDLRNNAFERLI
jgi:hypothetical protein